MLSIWPVALMIASNTLYQICAKSNPEKMNAFASLLVTYGVSFMASLILYLTTANGSSVSNELKAVNWAPFALGLALVGLETGSIFAYKAGWLLSSLTMIHNAVLAVILLFAGALLYGEAITLTKVIGMAVCLAGLMILNR